VFGGHGSEAVELDERHLVALGGPVGGALLVVAP
jgi:hypothetical protein